MKNKLTLHYSVQNGGDGSAYPRFMESAALAQYDQDHMSEGWGESCTGQFELESDSPILAISDIVTKEQYYIDLLEGGGDEDVIAEFVEQFFPKGKPTFTVKTRKGSADGKYLYNDVFVDGVKVASSFQSKGASGKAYEKTLNA